MRRTEIIAGTIVLVFMFIWYTVYVKSLAEEHEKNIQKTIDLEFYIPTNEEPFKICEQPRSGDYLSSTMYSCIRDLEDEIIKIRKNQMALVR